MRIDLKIYFENDDSLVTGFNGTYEQAIAYYVGQSFEMNDETVSKCIKIEQL